MTSVNTHRAEEYARLEHELARAQRLASVGQLAAGIAHDCNNLLTVIQGHSELIAADLPEGDQLRCDVEEIGRAAARAAALTRQLLTFGSPGERERVDLNGIVRGLETLLRRTAGETLELRVDLASRALPVHVDAGQVEQVLLNLVLNARDATPAGGAVVLETATVAVAPGEDRDPALAPGRYARVTVSDTGAGMPPEVLARALEPFFTTKSRGEGTGLGLATAAAIITHLGGDVTLTSTPGRGTTVEVLLPLAAPPAA